MDAGLAAAARKVEHYEMAGYKSARALAHQLGLRQAADLLQKTLAEEVRTDRLLAQISKRLVKEGLRSHPAAESKAQPRRAAAPRKRSSSSSRMMTDHDAIRNWAEERRAQPACVRGTGGREDAGMIRLNFPGYSGEDRLEPISWDDWFGKFDENQLALVVQDETAGGERSHFNKLVSREAAGQRRSRTARG